MRTLARIISILLSITLLIAAGALGYLWYKTGQRADQLVLLAKPFADISYDGVDVSPFGSVGINRVQIRPYTNRDTITIGSVRLNASNLLELMMLELRLSQNKPPEALSLSLQQINLPMNGEILNPPPETIQRHSPLDALDALGCGSITRFNGVEFLEMGYKEITSNITIGYRSNPDRQQLNLQIDSNTRNWMAIHLGVDLKVPNLSVLPLSPDALQPEITGLDISLYDDGFNQHRNNYCAAKSGEPVDTYVTHHVQLLAQRLSTAGIKLGVGILNAYRHFLLADSSQMTLTAQPDTPIDLSTLVGYSSTDIIKLLNLKLSVNQKPVDDLSFSLDTQRFAHLFAPEKPKPQPEEEIVEHRPKVVVIKKTFHPTPTRELSKHIGKIAKIQTSTGAKYTGTLGEITDEKINIMIRKPSGQLTLSLRLANITSAQVLY